MEHVTLSFSEKLYGDADLTFKQDSALAHTTSATKRWFKDHGAAVVARPAHSTDLSPKQNL